MISASTGERYAEPVAVIYRDAELRILSTITKALAQGIDAPGWEQLQLARIQSVRKSATAELARANPLVAAQIEGSLTAAYTAGGASALADVAGVLDPLNAPTLQKVAAVRALAAATADGLASAQNAVLRGVDDIYRSVVAKSSANVVAGAVGRREATQSAINQFLSKGLTGIQTQRGVMDISTYANMAVRTATARVTLQGHLDTMTVLDLDLVMIEPGPRPCDTCDYWAGKILTVNGVAGMMTVADLSGTGTIDVEVDATLDDARNDGWGHPNDRCNIATYLPGVTESAALERQPWDAEGYAAQQQQRAIERQIRGWKTAEATSITPERAAEASAKVESWQAAQRDLLANNEFLKRQYSREQI
jgi:hypothetical protein